MEEKLFIYYTNDFHSNFEQWPRVAGFLEEAKSTRKEHGDPYWIFDIGDHVDRVHPISEATMGSANVQLMNDLGYNLVTIGNNEGITLSHNDLYHLYDKANFNVVCSNLHSVDEQEPNWLKRTEIIETDSGVKIGVVGLTVPFNDYYDLLNWHVSPQYEALDNYVNVLKESTDIIILLSHLGISEDQEIARRYEDIDLIIGGHTHHLLRTGEVINQTLITAAGKHSFYIGEVILTWDHANHCLVQKEAYATDIAEVPKDLMTEQTLFQMQMKADKQLGKPIVHLEEPIEVKWFQDTTILKELTDTLKDWTMADCAMLNAGLLLDQLPAGDITYGDVHRICPHPINPVVVELRGNELLEVVRSAFTKDFMELKLKGFGFRGEVIGRMMFSGIQVKTDFHDNGEEYVVDAVFDGGIPFEADRTYTVATADTFTFGRLLPEVARSETKHYFLPEFLRDLLAATLQNKFAMK
ncbi:bifunctional metallophosphatase/5'-nucleotidase [Oceanobacillus chungangensis]|uniref:Bifunctional metallophosphatase/5'-nucleotidase n=1 Tax=Oceanobacillus chungangensis TaxID=1229152 RepID=A0A3D8PXY1_9BACI|nr:bifunctional UDP-sugar hydrolase/5'-nucleotidase [Oceanobacillus chungangensis]RDW20943.1 bifunctional metallophosphatase/5'-nucleotidase [Oceanobacillus chungangensis]